MLLSRFEFVCPDSLNRLNRILQRGWRPVRETPLPGGDGTTNVLILLEKESVPQQYPGEEIAPGVPVSFLHEVMLFEDLSDSELRLVLNECRVESVAPEATVFRKDDPGDCLQVVLKGTVDVILPELPVQGQSVVQLQPSGVFGESSFFAVGQHTMRAVAGSDGAVLLILDREAYDELFLARQSAALKIAHNSARILAARLQETDAWVWNLLAQSQQAQISASWRRYRHRVTGADSTTGFFGV